MDRGRWTIDDRGEKLGIEGRMNSKQWCPANKFAATVTKPGLRQVKGTQKANKSVHKPVVCFSVRHEGIGMEGGGGR